MEKVLLVEKGDTVPEAGPYQCINCGKIFEFYIGFKVVAYPSTPRSRKSFNAKHKAYCECGGTDFIQLTPRK